jgi:hypothetical protein
MFMDRLLGHLAQFASFSKQGELLCTHALAYLLRNPEGERVFSDFIASVAGSPLLGKLEWRPEITQADGGRPDLEGRSADGAAVVKIEAKLGAPFGAGQLESYISALRGGDMQRVLLILVPACRREEVISHTCWHFATEGPGPWRLEPAPCVHLAVAVWEQLFEALAVVSSEGFADDLAQFRAMYRVFNGDDIEPLTTDEQVLAWRERADWWLKLVDLATRRLAGERLLPLGLEQGSPPYHRRYVCRRLGNADTCYSLGTRDPLAGHTTPIWLRFHRDTGHFAQLKANLDRAPGGPHAVQSGGHLWFPLEVPRDSNRETMIGALVEQVQRLVAAAYHDSASLAS